MSVVHSVPFLLRAVTVVTLLALPLAAQDGAVVATPPTSGTTPIDPVINSTEESVAVQLEQPSLQAFDSAWDVATFDRSGPVTSEATRLSNLSVRALLTPTTPPVILGATVDGTGSLPVLVRAIGPTLLQHQVPTALPVAPHLQVFRGAALAAASNLLPPAAVELASRIGTFPAAAHDPVYAVGDAALVGLPRPGTLTAHMSSPARGIALLEVYDAPMAATAARFVNVSARAQVGSDANVMVLGFSIAGPGTKTLLLRGAGPSLAAFGVSPHLANPQLELYRGSQRLAANDDWSAGTVLETAQLTDAIGATGAFPFASDREAALIVTLPAGSYTLHVRSAAAEDTGIALAEVYELPATFATSFQAARSVNALGLALFAKMAGATNFALSPYSIESAFALAYTGAAGETRAEMARVLGFPADNTALSTGFKSIRSALEKAATDSVEIARRRSTPTNPITPITWAEANRLYGQDGYPFVPEFVEQLRRGWDSPLLPMDFIRDPNAARVAINTWVAEITRDRIQNLLPDRAVDELTRFVLVNALYFKGRWDQPFLVPLTTPGPFTLPDGSQVPVPMMRDRKDTGYEARDGAEVVALPYIGQQLQFLIILPAAGQTPAAFAAKLTPQHFERWANLGATAPQQIDLNLPKFKIEGTSLPLVDPLRQLGLRLAFSDTAADFTGIKAPRELYLQAAYHKVFIAVDETGTEAAAATAIIGGTTSVPPPVPVVTIDRPFLFAIQERTTGACLFLGQVLDPR